MTLGSTAVSRKVAGLAGLLLALVVLSVVMVALMYFGYAKNIETIAIFSGFALAASAFIAAIIPVQILAEQSKSDRPLQHLTLFISSVLFLQLLFNFGIAVAKLIS